MKLQEYRLSRVTEAAKAVGADVVVASLPANIAYLTGGYHSIGPDVLCRSEAYVAFSPAGQKLVYVMGTAEIPSVLEHDPDAEIYCFGGFGFFAAEGDAFGEKVLKIREGRYPGANEALAAAIDALGGGTVALDESRVNFDAFAGLSALLPGKKLIPATGLFMEARKVKHPDEIEGVRRSSVAAEQCLAYALEGFKPGMTELDLEKRYREAAGRMDAVPYFFVATIGLRAAFSDTINTPLAAKPGDMIRFDFGVILDGYCSDLARTASVGEPTEKVRAYYEAVKAGTETAIAAIKPGIAAEEVFRIAEETTIKSGIPHYKRHHCGHGCGLETYDLYSIAPGVKDTLEENMVYCIETPYYELGWGGVQIEDTIAVTKDGARYLDEGSRELIVLPL